MTEAQNEIFLSVVAAAYNEEENVSQLVKEIDAMQKELAKPCEIVIINDGSTDRTLEVLKELMPQYPQLRVLTFTKNTGQTAALEAVLRSTRGKYIANLDADLQNDPADIPKLLAYLTSDQCDLVNGWRKNRQDPWIRLVSTKIANGVRNWLTKETIHDSACGLKVYRRECIQNIKFFNGLHRFIPTLVKMNGFRVLEIPVNHRPRTAGVAKYGVGNRMFRALRDTFAIRWMQSRHFSYEVKEIER